MTDAATPGGPRRRALRSRGCLLVALISAAVLAPSLPLAAAASVSPVGIVTASVRQGQMATGRDDTPGPYTALLAVTLLYFEPDTVLEVYVSSDGADSTTAAYALLGEVTTDGKGRASLGGTVTTTRPPGALTIRVVRPGGMPAEALAWRTFAVGAPPDVDA